jgi:hypothetical protein
MHTTSLGVILLKISMHVLRDIPTICGNLPSYQIVLVTNFMVSFEQLAIRTKNLTFFLYKECFISGLKEEIQVQVRMKCPTIWLEAT